MREIGRHPYISERREIGWDREREERERGREKGRVLDGGWSCFSKMVGEAY